MMMSLKKQKVQANTLQNTYSQTGESSTYDMVEYKMRELDPVAANAIREVDMYVAAQAADLRNDLLEDMCLTNYKFTSAEVWEAVKKKHEARLLKEVQKSFDEDDEMVSTEEGEKEKVTSDEDWEKNGVLLSWALLEQIAFWDLFHTEGKQHAISYTLA